MLLGAFCSHLDHSWDSHLWRVVGYCAQVHSLIVVLMKRTLNSDIKSYVDILLVNHADVMFMFFIFKLQYILFFLKI